MDRKEYFKEYENRRKQQRHEYYLRNKEYIIEQTKLYKKKYPEKNREYRNKYYHQNKEKAIQRVRDWQARNKDCVNEYAKKCRDNKKTEEAKIIEVDYETQKREEFNLYYKQMMEAMFG